MKIETDNSGPDSRTAQRIIFTFQYLMFAAVILVYIMAVAFGRELSQWYETAIPDGIRNLLGMFEYRRGRFPQSAAHSALTISVLIIVYITALVNARKYFRQKINWDGKNINSLTENLSDHFFSKILIRPLASYLEANFSKIYEPVRLPAEGSQLLSVPHAIARYFLSKSCLAMIVFELLGLIVLFFFSRDVGAFRFFTFNTISIIFGVGVLFKFMLIATALFYRRVSEGSHGE